MKLTRETQTDKSYQTMPAENDYDLTVAAIKEALTEFDDRENWTTHEQVFAELLRKSDIK